MLYTGELSNPKPMDSVSSISELPNVPAVYALYGGRKRNLHVAYAGIAESLRRRITQHLITRDSSVATGTSAVHLNPDYVTEIRWWAHSDFKELSFREAAEVIAFEVLDPALRSRGAITGRARQLCSGAKFYGKMRSLFSGEPSGHIILPTLQNALERIADLEKRVAELEKRYK
ncbi:MAG TPA: hypothetical protein VFD58_25495 [Blastocatellia bacterium]|nr:hypothetical protein [Blastocatellia bacterium]